MIRRNLWLIIASVSLQYLTGPDKNDKVLLSLLLFHEARAAMLVGAGLLSESFLGSILYSLHLKRLFGGVGVGGGENSNPSIVCLVK